MHYGHRGVAPLEAVRHAESVDQPTPLAVLRKDVVVVRLDRFAADRDRSRQSANRGRCLHKDHTLARVMQPLGCAEAGHASAEHDGVISGWGHRARTPPKDWATAPYRSVL